MSKQILIEHIPFNVAQLTLTEGVKGDSRMRVRGKLQEAGVKNGNGRVYPQEILKSQVEKYIQSTGDFFQSSYFYKVIHS